MIESRGRRAAGRGHLIAQFGHVFARLGRVLHRAAHGLEDELLSHATREAQMHARVDQRLHEHEDVSRAGAAERGRHVQIGLIVDEKFLAQRAEDGLGLTELFLGHFGRGRPHSHALADLSRCIGHGPHD